MYNDIKEKLDQIVSKDIDFFFFTSSNAIKNFVNKYLDKSCLVIVVGKKSREIALQNGFTNVLVAGSNINEALTYIINNYHSRSGKIIYCRGDHITLDIAQYLASLNYNVD